MRAYYFDNVPGDQRLPHEHVPSRPVSEETLRAIKLFYKYIPVDIVDQEDQLNRLAVEREYKSRDQVAVSKESLGDAYEDTIKIFFEEHMHEDEEIRYILEGSGFFDVREMPTDAWIRVAASPGDLLIIPAGMYHRFSLDERDSCKAVRLFKEMPSWTAYPRSAATDSNPFRVGYLQTINVNA